MSRCPNCPTVPVVSWRLAQRVLANVPLGQRPGLAVAALEWLTARHEGLNLFEGINGRPYEEFERDLIALEVGIVENLPCPFWRANDCLLGGLGEHFNYTEEAGKPPYGWLPALVATFYDRNTYRELVKRGAVADAKIALVTRNELLDVASMVA